MPDSKSLKGNSIFTIYIDFFSIWPFPPSLATISISLLFSFCLPIDRSFTDRYTATEALEFIRNPAAPEHM